MSKTTTDVLGRELPVLRTYEDGSFDCPHCRYAILAPARDCANPCCLANPQMPRATAERLDAEARTRAAAERQRQMNHARAMERIALDEQDRALRRARVAVECANRGACLACARADERVGRPVRFVRHRAECPKGRVA